MGMLGKLMKMIDENSFSFSRFRIYRTFVEMSKSFSMFELPVDVSSYILSDFLNLRDIAMLQKAFRSTQKNQENQEDLKKLFAHDRVLLSGVQYTDIGLPRILDWLNSMKLKIGKATITEKQWIELIDGQYFRTTESLKSLIVIEDKNGTLQDEYRLPLASLVTFRSLESLHLINLTQLPIAAPIGFILPCLRELCLVKTNFSVDSWTFLFGNSRKIHLPNLTHLQLKEVKHFHFQISSLSNILFNLHTLEVWNCDIAADSLLKFLNQTTALLKSFIYSESHDIEYQFDSTQCYELIKVLHRFPLEEIGLHLMKNLEDNHLSQLYAHQLPASTFKCISITCSQISCIPFLRYLKSSFGHGLKKLNIGGTVVSSLFSNSITTTNRTLTTTATATTNSSISSFDHQLTYDNLLPSLTELDISFCSMITDTILCAGIGSMFLRKLNLEHCGQITDTGITLLLRKYPQLEELNINSIGMIGSNDITSMTFHSLCTYGQNLMRLTLGRHRCMTMETIWNIIQSCRRLYYLEIALLYYSRDMNNDGDDIPAIPPPITATATTTSTTTATTTTPNHMNLPMIYHTERIRRMMQQDHINNNHHHLHEEDHDRDHHHLHYSHHPRHDRRYSQRRNQLLHQHQLQQQQRSDSMLTPNEQQQQKQQQQQQQEYDLYKHLKHLVIRRSNYLPSQMNLLVQCLNGLKEFYLFDNTSSHRWLTTDFIEFLEGKSDIQVIKLPIYSFIDWRGSNYTRSDGKRLVYVPHRESFHL
jgi:hypothetical protein